MAVNLALMQANGLFNHPDDFDHDDSVRARQEAEALVARHVAAAGWAVRVTSTPWNMAWATTSSVGVHLDHVDPPA